MHIPQTMSSSSSQTLPRQRLQMKGSYSSHNHEEDEGDYVDTSVSRKSSVPGIPSRTSSDVVMKTRAMTDIIHPEKPWGELCAES